MKNYQVLDICSGAGSSSKVFTDMGAIVYTVDIEESYGPDLIADITKISPEEIQGIFDVVIFAPPCEKMSIASNNLGHWIKDDNTGIIKPISKEAKQSVKIVNSGLKIIKYQQFLNPELIYFIENPRGKMRYLKIMQEFHRDSACYCRYGDIRMKPTDFWHNSKRWIPRQMCKNGRDSGLIKTIDGVEWVMRDNGKPCHQRAQRPINRKNKSTQLGTFGLKTYLERSAWPYELSYDIAIASHRELKSNIDRSVFNG